MNIGDMPDVKVRFEVQQPNIAPAWMIGARTHLLDCWEPQLEWIRMPELQFPRRDYWVSLDEAGHSRSTKHELVTPQFSQTVASAVGA